MTDAVLPAAKSRPRAGSSAVRIRKRYAAERRFRLYGLGAILLAMAMLAILIGSIVLKGYSAFTQTEIALEINFDPQVIDPAGTRDPATLVKADYATLIKAALAAQFPEATSRQDKRALAGLVGSGAAYDLQQRVMDDPSLIGTTAQVWLAASDDLDMLNKGHIRRDVAESERRVDDRQIAWFDTLSSQGHARQSFNSVFFTAADSREPEEAGIWGAIVGSLFTMLITLLLSFPLGVATA